MDNYSNFSRLDKIIQMFAEKYGNIISHYDRGFILKCVEKKAIQNCLDSPEAYLNLALNNSDEAQKFLDSLNVNYSEFFRSPITFLSLKHNIFPMILKLKEKSHDKNIRVWSAGCAAGQEVYSIAIILDEILTESFLDFKYHIFATDLNIALIETAKKGLYSFNDVKNVSLDQIFKYFTKYEDGYRVNSRLKENIVFSFYDLYNESTSCPPESIYGEFDLILCSNLIFYYGSSSQKIIIKKIKECLPPGGFLVTGEAEKATIEKESSFLNVKYDIPVFQKVGGFNK